MASERITTAAGGIVWRNRPGSARPDPRVELLVVHRPSYDDWTFPKGKTDPGEALQTTAVREIGEEAGVRVRLGHPLQEISYPISDGTKRVAYWCARVVGPDDSDRFTPNKEVDQIRWVSVRDARGLLTYQHDVELLETFRTLREAQAHRTRTLVVLRHGKAVPRSSGIEELERPLTAAGLTRAKALVPVLGAYGVRRIVSSPAVRCAQTVEPYAHSIDTFLEIDDRLSEDTRAAQVQRSVAAILDRKKPVVLCSHRPTLPWVFEALGIDPVELAPGQGVVVHHRKGLVHATELLA
ncbi:NUDIX hydrolase [Aeromicrobium yanjiei]|uniref:NUDIX domain-containing protein n=1 Tax=Aeromicrobium yanjiei TaxID=2662028 RepID=A0A5Q2MF28_9ACTN|nr:NUDIX domain-containing protein [Aeromicrobium yanjiei]QGG40353.1 NUDIX domain-containing protein [Aeromicrobium yanjiei]